MTNYSNSYYSSTIAYMDGERPISKWTKKDIFEVIKKCKLKCSIEQLNKLSLLILRRKFLKWKRTCFINGRTVDFYIVDTQAISNVTDNDIAMWLNSTKEAHIKPVEEVWECSFIEWIGPHYALTAKRVKEVGVIRGIWFYRSNGTKKKITSNGFEMLVRKEG